jgi:hypothetical protein
MGDYIDALRSVASYNGLDKYLLEWLKIKDQRYLIPLDDYGAPGPELKDVRLQLQVIWMIAVSLFGNWGTSPRYGWIEDYPGFKSWVLLLTEPWRESDEYDGPEEYRITPETF